jgi:hypothetical protein
MTDSATRISFGALFELVKWLNDSAGLRMMIRGSGALSGRQTAEMR